MKNSKSCRWRFGHPESIPRMATVSGFSAGGKGVKETRFL
jgi:hypothetical protein